MPSQQIPDVPYHRFAELIGLHGIYVDFAGLRSGLHGMRRSRPTGPVVLEVKTDPNVPPLPPHITLDQAKKFHVDAGEGRS